MDGYIYGNMPLMTMRQGDRVRWYVTTLGDFNNAHTPHWHGNTVVVAGQRTDVLVVTSAQMITADMVPDTPGIWLFHCHISDHMLAGMVARYEVKPRSKSKVPIFSPAAHREAEDNYVPLSAEVNFFHDRD